MNPRPFPPRGPRTYGAIILGCLLASASQPSARAAETEVFRTSPPENRDTGSGFDARAGLRIEPTDGRSLALNLKSLPSHHFLKVQAVIDIHTAPGMDLGLMMMAGGRKIDPATMPRSRLLVTVDGDKTAVDSSFGGIMGVGGSFPDREGHFLHLPGTGSAHGPIDVKGDDPEAAFGMIGDWDGDKMKQISRYQVTFVVPHSAPEASVEFSWILPKSAVEGGIDVFAAAGVTTPFSIKSLDASILDSPVPMDAAGFIRRYDELGGADPTVAMEALNDLISAGREILPRLRQKLEDKAGPDLQKKYAEALAAMDDASFLKRAAAAKALTDLGNEVIPLARKTLSESASDLSVETKSALENLADRMEHGEAATAEHIRANRLHRLLDTLGAKDAENLRAALPPPKIVVSPEISSMVDSLLAIMGGGVDGFAPGGDPFGPGIEDLGDDPFAAPPAPAAPDEKD